MSNNGSSAAGLFGCLFPSFFIVGLIVLTLKLAQVGLPATWSWWFVLLPWYIMPLGFVIFLIVIAVLILRPWGLFGTELRF